MILDQIGMGSRIWDFFKTFPAVELLKYDISSLNFHGHIWKGANFTNLKHLEIVARRSSGEIWDDVPIASNRHSVLSLVSLF
jgi:hypothetical protein